ncbi:nitrite reductase [Desulfolithobacter sp.]
MEQEKTESLTILCEAGLVSPEFLQAVNDVVQKYQLTLYLSTAQNLRLLEVKEKDRQAIMEELAGRVGARFKGQVKYPLAKVCVSTPHCKFGRIDTFGLEKKISSLLSDLAPVKPKLKIAISGCNMACSAAMTTDIGIVGTPKGMDVYVGGKLGSFPQVGRRVVRGAGEDKVLEMIRELVLYHDGKTKTKQRMFKLLKEPDFPYPDAV